MRRMIGAALVAGAVALGGCAMFQPSEDTTAYEQAQDPFIVLLSALVLAKQADEISQEDWDRVFLPLIERGNSILDRLAESPEATLADALRAELNEIVLELAREQGAAQ